MLRKLLTAIGVLLALAVLAGVALRLWLRSDVIRVTVERQATAALGMPVRIGGAHATVLPRLGLDLSDVEIGQPARAHIGEASVTTGFGLIFSRRVEDADIALTGGEIDAALVAGLAAIGGAGADTVADPSTTGAPFTIASIRSIRFRDVNVVAGEERIPVNLDAALAGDRLEVTSVVARLRDATLHVRGEMASLAAHRGSFEVRADVLPVDALLGVLDALSRESAAAQPRSGGGRTPFEITATISSPEATLGTGRVTSLDARLEATSGRIVLEPLKFDMDEGRFEARLTFDPAAAMPTLDARGVVSGMDVARLQDPAGEARKSITGRLGARFALQAPSQPGFSALLSGARGSVELEVRDGRMPGIQLIRETVIRFANRNQPAPAGAGSDAFSRLDALLTLQGGTARIGNLVMKSADFDLTGSGTLSLPNGGIALDLDVTLTEALSQQAGRDLYRYAREGKRIVLPATVAGTLTNPSVSIDVAEAASRALKNRAQDEVQSILDRAIKGIRVP